jgi:adenylate cyclase class IV
LEVELIAQSNEELSEKRDQLFEFLSDFGFNQKDSIRKSYLELIIREIGK